MCCKCIERVRAGGSWRVVEEIYSGLVFDEKIQASRAMCLKGGRMGVARVSRCGKAGGGVREGEREDGRVGELCRGVKHIVSGFGGGEVCGRERPRVQS